MATETTEGKAAKVVDIKEYLAEHGKKKTVVKLAERKAVIIIAATDQYTEGQIIEPHITVADFLISKKIAKEYKEDKED